ncbi:MAG: tetratricopeptide repeat protein [Desulfatibacillaceae bacterium]|nr:tetratricopeptide repeat protein [Desulfatibacillaceae bacterium]
MLSAIAKKFSSKSKHKQSRQDIELDWKKKTQALLYLIRTGKKDEAIDLATELVEFVEERFPKDAPEKATTYNNMGMVLMLEHDWDLADECFREALAMRRRLFGDMHKEVALTYMNLIELYKQRAYEILSATKETA